LPEALCKDFRASAPTDGLRAWAADDSNGFHCVGGDETILAFSEVALLCSGSTELAFLLGAFDADADDRSYDDDLEEAAIEPTLALLSSLGFEDIAISYSSDYFGKNDAKSGSSSVEHSRDGRRHRELQTAQLMVMYAVSRWEGARR
jgi:hypothetical protein